MSGSSPYERDLALDPDSAHGGRSGRGESSDVPRASSDALLGGGSLRGMVSRYNGDMSYTTPSVGATGLALRFAAACPKPGYRLPLSACWLPFYPGWDRLREVTEKHDAELPLAIETWSDLSLPESEREAARLGYLALRDEVEAETVLAENWRKENVQRLRDELREHRAKRVEKALAALLRLENILQDEAFETRVVATISNDHRTKRDAGIGKPKIAGGESLSNLRRGIEALLPKPEVELVSPVEFRRLQEEGADMSGYRITFGKLLPRGSYD